MRQMTIISWAATNNNVAQRYHIVNNFKVPGDVSYEFPNLINSSDDKWALEIFRTNAKS